MPSPWSTIEGRTREGPRIETVKASPPECSGWCRRSYAYIVKRAGRCKTCTRSPSPLARHALACASGAKGRVGERGSVARDRPLACLGLGGLSITSKSSHVTGAVVAVSMGTRREVANKGRYTRCRTLWHEQSRGGKSGYHTVLVELYLARGKMPPRTMRAGDRNNITSLLLSTYKKIPFSI